MEGIFFGKHVLLLVIVIEEAMKCQASFCSDRYNNLNKELVEHLRHCSDQKEKSPCCKAEKSSMDVRRQKYKELCAECMIDLVLVVDTSHSVGQLSFDRDVKPFLQSLVTDTALNVGCRGTHVALIIFSQKERTKVLLNFGDICDKQQLANYIEDLRWDKVRGDRTRTDLALRIVNDQVFTGESPGNHRANIDDAVIIITDGAPRGKWRTKEDAIRYAGLLKEKDILVIGVACGPNRKRFLHILREMTTSENYTFDVMFNDMDNILERLVATACY